MSDAATLRARPRTVLRALAKQAPILLAVVLPPALIAGLTGEWAFMSSLLAQVLVLGALTVQQRPASIPADLRYVEAMVTFALLFVLASLLVVPPLMTVGLGAGDALFEAISGITSTGLSVAGDTAHWPVAAHLLRGWTQWCGGLAIAFAGLALLSEGSASSLSMGASALGERDHLTSMKLQARHVLLAYVALSVVATVLCVLLLPTWWEAVCIALAAVSTGGFTPRADSLTRYTPLAQGVVIGICVSAALSLLFYIRIWRDGLRSAVTASRVLPTLALMAGGTVLYVAAESVMHGTGPGALYTGALNFLSGFTTAGFSIGDVSASSLLVPFLLPAMIIGGDVGSTAGGIKVRRLLLLLRIVRLSVLRVRVPPSAVTYLGDAGARVRDERIVAVTSLLVLYLVALLLAWGIFLASGVPSLPGLFEVISALSTVGLSLGLTDAATASHLKFTLGLAMLLGRVEFIALLLLFLPGTWRNRG